MKRVPVLTTFGLNVRKLREAKGLTQEVLAEKAELHSTYVSGIERGVRNPSLLIVIRIAHGLGARVSEIFRGIA